MKFCRWTLFEAGKALFMNNWKIYSRKTSRVLTVKAVLLTHFVAFEEYMSDKAIFYFCRRRKVLLLIYLFTSFSGLRPTPASYPGARSIQPKFQPVRPGKEDHLKRWTRFSKLFRLDRTDPLSFGPKFPESLVEWIAPQTSLSMLAQRKAGRRQRASVWQILLSRWRQE